MTLKNKISNLYINKNYSSPLVVYPILKINPIEYRDDILDKTEQGYRLKLKKTVEKSLI